MKEEYQIGKGQAVEGFRSWAKENEEPLKLTFATAEVIELAQQGLGELLRQVGRQFIETTADSKSRAQLSSSFTMLTVSPHAARYDWEFN